MPSPTTAADLINKSFRLAKILGAGETPSADEANDALTALNDILEDWDTQPLALWGTANEVFSTVANQGTYTIGPTGNWVTDRPMRIKGAFARVDSGIQAVDYPLNVVDQLEFNYTTQKLEQQWIPERLMYVPEFPLGQITLWPVPDRVLEIHMSVDRVLTQIPSVGTSINYPPGAAKALRYRLAVELAIEYGVPTDPALLQLAQEAFGNYKRANKQQIKALYDAALTVDHGYVDWRTAS